MCAPFLFVWYDFKRLRPYELSQLPCLLTMWRSILQEGGKGNIGTTILHADKTLETNEVCLNENKVILLLTSKWTERTAENKRGIFQSREKDYRKSFKNYRNYQ